MSEQPQQEAESPKLFNAGDQISLKNAEDQIFAVPEGSYTILAGKKYEVLKTEPFPEDNKFAGSTQFVTIRDEQGVEREIHASFFV